MQVDSQDLEFELEERESGVPFPDDEEEIIMEDVTLEGHY